MVSFVQAEGRLDSFTNFNFSKRNISRGLQTIVGSSFIVAVLSVEPLLCLVHSIASGTGSTQALFLLVVCQ